MGERVGLSWQRSYKFMVLKILSVLKTRSNRLHKARIKAERKLKTVAGRLLREFAAKAGVRWRLIYLEPYTIAVECLAASLPAVLSQGNPTLSGRLRAERRFKMVTFKGAVI